MNIVIAVFKKNWVEAQMLFKFISAVGITIEGQDTYGDRVHEVKEDFLFVNNKTKVAKWISKEDATHLSSIEFLHYLHYDSMIHNLKNIYIGNNK